MPSLLRLTQGTAFTETYTFSGFIALKMFICSSTAELLQSKEFVDNSERADLIKELKESQMEIYNKRNQLIFEKLFKLQFEEITTKGIEAINKNLDEIYAEGEKLFTENIQKLVKNSDDIQNKSLQEIENFKQQVNTVSYDFSKDNHNEKKYNDYDELNSIEDLVEKEVKPILEKNKEDRTEYIKKLNSYIDEYDEYCSHHPDFKNHRCTLAVENIQNTYKDKLKTTGFIL